MSESNIMLHQSGMKSDVFETAARWKTSYRFIDFRRHCQAGAEMMMMPRPWIVSFRIAARFDPRYEPPIQMIVSMERASCRIQEVFFTRQHNNSAAHGLSPLFQLRLVLANPIRSYLGIRVR
jgi:hypothetical protein